MANFTVTVPDAFVPTILPAVSARVLAIDGSPVVTKILAAWGVADVASLTATQKGELVCLVYLWQLTRSYERDLAVNSARDATETEILDDFNP